MKKIFLFITLFAFAQLLFSGELSHTYHFSKPTITQNGTFQVIDFEGSIQSGLAGNPSLPYHAIKLLLPPGEVVTGMEIIRENEQLVSGTHVLRPYQPSQPLSTTTTPERLYNSAVYQSTEPYPAEAGRLPATHFMNGYGFALGAFTPVTLIPATGQLSYFESVTVILHTTPQAEANQSLKMLQTAPQITNRAQKFADNPEQAAAYPVAASRTTDQYKLLIITSQQFAEGFSELIDMYLERGIRWQIATKEDIAANGTGMDVQEKIMTLKLFLTAGFIVMWCRAVDMMMMAFLLTCTTRHWTAIGTATATTCGANPMRTTCCQMWPWDVCPSVILPNKPA